MAVKVRERPERARLQGTAAGREVVGGGGKGVRDLARATRQHALGPAWPISGRAIAPVSRPQSGQMTDGG